jgi:hypothetical protein
MPSNIRSTTMIPVHILIQHINRERGQSRRCNTPGAGTIPGTSKTGNIGDKVNFELSVSFHQLGLSQLQFCSRGYYLFSNQCYGTYMNYLRIYLLLNFTVPKYCNDY